MLNFAEFVVKNFNGTTLLISGILKTFPYPVEYLALNIKDTPVRMAYMDEKPEENANGKTVVLFNGKNFFGAYWGITMAFLLENGFRVVVPDQIGFGKSPKPDIQYSFHLLAAQTKKLLDSLNIKKAAVVGHSMGGMVATRFALMYPEITTHLVLENPIGLEDYGAKVPYTPVEEHYQATLNQTEEAIREYHKNYYAEWQDAYEQYVQVHAQWAKSGEYPRLAWSSALTSDMIFTQPVVYEFPQISVPTLMVIGQEDRTALGKDKVSEEVAASMGNYPRLGKETAAAIPNAKLVDLQNIGHIPHLEATERFHQELLGFLK